jgi:hypothetical protein
MTLYGFVFRHRRYSPFTIFRNITKNSAHIFIFSIFISKFPRALILRVSRLCPVTILTKVRRRITIQQCKWLTMIPSYSMQYGPYSLTSVSFRMIAHTTSSVFFFHLLTPTDLRSFSVQSNHQLTFGLHAFLLPSGSSPRSPPPKKKTFSTVLPLDILIRWPNQSILLSFIIVTTNKS